MQKVSAYILTFNEAEKIEAAVSSVGRPLRDDAARPPVSSTPAARAWWRRGERGWLRLGISLSPQPAPLVQTLTVEAVLDPSDGLRSAAEAVLGAVAADGELPQGLAVGPAFDRERFRRAALAAGARFGALRLGLPTAGDGALAAAWELRTERGGRACLRVALDPETGALAEGLITVAGRAAPAEGW